MGIGFWQILLIVVLVLIIFGAGKLPNVMKDVAKGIKSFKEGLNEEAQAEVKPTIKKIAPPKKTVKAAVKSKTVKAKPKPKKK